MSWSYGNWVYYYICNQCLSPLTLWVRIQLRWVLDTTLCDKVCQWLATSLWFSPDISTNKTDHHNITEILLKVEQNMTLLLMYKHNARYTIDNIIIILAELFNTLWQYIYFTCLMVLALSVCPFHSLSTYSVMSIFSLTWVVPTKGKWSILLNSFYNLYFKEQLNFGFIFLKHTKWNR